MLVDDLSRNRLSAFLSKMRSPDPQPTALPPGTRRTAPGPYRLDITSLDEMLLRYCNRGLADSTHRLV